MHGFLMRSFLMGYRCLLSGGKRLFGRRFCPFHSHGDWRLLNRRRLRVARLLRLLGRRLVTHERRGGRRVMAWRCGERIGDCAGNSPGLHGSRDRLLSPIFATMPIVPIASITSAAAALALVAIRGALGAGFGGLSRCDTVLLRAWT